MHHAELFGARMAKVTAPDGSKDENVFDISRGRLSA